MKTISIIVLTFSMLSVTTAYTQDDSQEGKLLEFVKSRLEKAQSLEKEHRYAEAVTEVEAAVASLEKAVQSGQEPEWHINNDILWGADLARRDLLDHPRALRLAEKVIELNEGDYWETNARMNMAGTYRDWGKYQEAEKQYDRVLEMSERNRPRVLHDHGQMLYYELGKKQQGQKEILEAAHSEELHHGQRIRAVEALVRDKLENRRYEEALELLEILTDFPHLKEEQQTQLLAEAYYKMGEVRQTMGEKETAKEFYRKAMHLEGGDMKSRVLARNALEDILYFE